VLGATLDRSGANAASSLNRSVYVAADRAHWSAVYADTVWFDPDTLMTLKDGAQVTSWTTSTATRNVLGNLVNLVPRAGTVPKITDASGHVSLYFNGSSSLYSTSQIANPRVDLTGMSDFSMLKLLGYPTAWGYTMSRELDGVHNGTVVAFRHHFGGLQTTLSSHYAGWGSNTIANAATVSSWLVMNGYNDASAQSLAVNNRILSTTANSLMFANSGKGSLGGVGTLAVGGSGWVQSGGAEFVTGVMGDQIAFNYGLSAAMRGEVATYLAAKYQSEGRLVVASSAGGTYDLSLSANANPTLDDLLQLNTTALGVGNDTIKTAGADYVNAGSGNDVISVTDLAFRFIDGGLGRDTLKLDAAYQGRSAMVLADFVSNVRGISGVAAADERVNAAGYHGLAGLEVLDLRQTDAAPGSVVAQVLTVAAADVGQLSETNRLEVLLGDRDVLLTSGFSAAGYGHFLVEGQSYSARYSATLNNQSVELYVRGGRLAPDLEGMSLSGSAMQLDFNTALTGAAPLLGDFSINTWGGAASGLSSVTSLNNRQSLYMAFSSAVTSPIQVVYNGSLKDEFGRSLGHTVWGLGTEGSDTLDASSWSAAAGAAIMAGAGNDRVTGTAGVDLIVGGLGADTLTGGSGSDRFAYNTVNQGSGGTGGLGGTAGDVITDFNTSSNSTQADVLDLSDLFQLAPGDSLTGDAQHDAQTLVAGGYIDLVRVNSGKDLQVWVDRDGGDVMGQLVTLQDIGAGLGNYFSVPNESAEQLLQRLLTEGRMQVTHA
jgi:Ca2+-binding RTX toxin-like protein